MKHLSLLGSTGSIGTQTLDVVRAHPTRFSVAAIAAKDELDAIEAQVREFSPKLVCVKDEETARVLEKRVAGPRIVSGAAGLQEVATLEGADLVVGALVGFLGVKPTLAAIDAGKNVALANKETLVAAGHLVMDAVQKKDVTLTPIDSEHSALFQCLVGERRGDVARMVITASGGPFKFRQRADLASVTPEQALGHPTWKMGAKITIDSATMFNKGLEVIEAHWLYGLPYDRIEAVIHPQSTVHSMVEFADGSVMAQLATADMRLPIQYALAYPERLGNDFPRLNLLDVQKLEFYPMDHDLFPGFGIAVNAGRAKGSAPAVMNAANEIAVYAFLNREIPYLAISEVVDAVVKSHPNVQNPSLSEVLDADAWARKEARKIVEQRKEA